MEDFEKELKLGFLDEAEQAITDVEACFLVIEKNGADAESLNKIFRLAHNLKGSSKAVGFDGFGEFTHQFESFILKLKEGQIKVSAKVINILLRANDFVLKMVHELRADQSAQFSFDELVAEMLNYNEEENCQSPGAGVPENVSQVIDSGLVSPETSITAEPNASSAETVNSVKEVQYDPSVKKSTPVAASGKINSSDESIRVALTKIEKLINFVGEMVILNAVMHEQAVNEVSPLMRKTIQQLGKVGKEIQDISMSLRMMPIKPTFQKMQRIVRDTSESLNKEIEIVLRGEETELDKTVLERINDPLVHLIRNSIDHGIEKKELRLERGKNPVGKVGLSARQDSGKLILEISDDGGGLDAEKLKNSAIGKGLLKPGADLTEKEAYNLIFAPGFSTKEQVTEVSGRGVGMDVVKTNISELGGEIQIESQLGKGTTFRIMLPLSMSIIDSMIVRYSEHRFVLPLAHVYETIRIQSSNIQTNTALGTTLLLRGENLPLIHLGDLFAIQSTIPEVNMIALVIRSTQKPFALMVEDIISQMPIVLKPLSPELYGVRGISGTTILGDGKPALILDPSELLKRKLSQMPKIKDSVDESMPIQVGSVA